MKSDYGSGWSILGYQSIVALAEGIKKAGNTDCDKVSKALVGLTFDTPVGKRTFNVKTHETFARRILGRDGQGSELSVRDHEDRRTTSTRRLT